MSECSLLDQAEIVCGHKEPIISHWLWIWLHYWVSEAAFHILAHNAAPNRYEARNKA